jgi:Flp pilus assembly protein TadD
LARRCRTKTGAARRSPNTAPPSGHAKLGAILVTVGRAEEARQEFITATTLDPQNETARQALKALDQMEGRHGSDGARR